MRDHQRGRLFELCEFEARQKWTLLYRGTQHGFKARDFHSRCDFKQETLTIVKTAGGHVFGGFTEAYWDQSCAYKSDANAFVFSLVNQEGKPMRLGIREESKHKAIYCSPCGPIFGSGHDFAIFFHSGAVTCFSYLKGSYMFNPSNSLQRRFFLTGEENSRVVEIEVFQKI